jgi:hypothetical protein
LDNRVDNFLVSGTPAEITRKSVSNSLFGGLLIRRQKLGSGHQKSRRANPTLSTTVFEESGLDWM